MNVCLHKCAAVATLLLVLWALLEAVVVRGGCKTCKELIRALNNPPSPRRLPDVAARFKRYSIEGSYWGTREILYRITEPSSRLDLRTLEKVFERAFAAWEEETALKFVRTETGEVHIEISFTRAAHGDGEPFDGKGNVLAHAFFPRYGGDLHFDDDEHWSANKSSGVDLYAVAVHEIGHALGLKHSHNPMAIMAPFYKHYTGDRLHLHSDDILAVRRLYGPVHEQQDTAKWRKDVCSNPYIDAITRLANKTTFAFRGAYFFEIRDAGVAVDPKLIRDYWPFTGPITAATTDLKGNVYIFEESVYWLLSSEGKLQKNYPRNITVGLVDMPQSIDAALLWHADDKPYFFRNDKYWRYSKFGMPYSWPRSISEIFDDDPPKKIDAAFRLNKNTSYLFYKDKYWRVRANKSSMKAARGYPRLLSRDWLHCHTINKR